MSPLTLLIVILTSFQPQTHEITGRVLENDTWNTPLYGATIYFPDLETGTTTNIQGYLNLTNIPSGKHVVRISFVGYATHNDTLSIPADSALVFRLDKIITEMDELRITAKGRPSQQAEQARVSTINVTDLPLNNIPRFMGEPDLIRVIQNLPGVKTESDFTGGFHVRGGRNDQNLILLDGVPVYNPWHLFGLFSAFNSEALEKVELTKGVFPARYGGRVSSVLDISLQEGSERHGAGYLTVSPLSSSFSFGRPINQNTSLLLAVRRTYMDPILWIANLAMQMEDSQYKYNTSMKYYFQDINAKVVHTFRPGLQLESAIFHSSDVFDVIDEELVKQNQNLYKFGVEVGWRNTTGSVKLTNRNEHLVSVSHAYISRYVAGTKSDAIENNLNAITDTDLFVTTDEIFGQGFNQYFTDYGFRQDLTWDFHNQIAFHSGLQWVLHDFRDISFFREEIDGYPLNPDGSIPEPAPPSARMVDNYTEDALQTLAHEAGVYATFSLNVGALSLHPGLRYDWYSAGNYQYVLPRINASLDITPRFYISAGYGHFTQYLHILGIDMIRTPTDRWFWSDEIRKPLFTETATLGFGLEFPGLGDVTVEGYYKNMDGLLNFSPVLQAEAFVSEFIPRFSTATISGSGESYGVEFLFQRNIGKISGWLGYTLSWTWSEFEEMNRGNRFPSRTDKRHDIQTFLSWDFAENWSAGAIFNFRTGQPLSFSTEVYLIEQDPLEVDDIFHSDGPTMVILETHNFRLPNYHPLDLNITWKNRRLFRRPGEVSLNVVNVYNRLNPLYVTQSARIQELPNGNLRIRPDNKYVGQLPVLPVLSMRIALGGDAR